MELIKFQRVPLELSWRCSNPFHRSSARACRRDCWITRLSSSTLFHFLRAAAITYLVAFGCRALDASSASDASKSQLPSRPCQALSTTSSWHKRRPTLAPGNWGNEKWRLRSILDLDFHSVPRLIKDSSGRMKLKIISEITYIQGYLSQLYRHRGEKRKVGKNLSPCVFE